MIRKILRKILKIEQKSHPKFFEKERVYFVRQQDGHYEARNLRDGKVIPDYKFEAVEEGGDDKAKSWKERFFDYVSAPPPLTPYQQMREEYFRAKGIRASMQEDLFCPIDPDERRDFIIPFLRQVPYDLGSILILFDPDVDSQNSEWLFRMGWVYGIKEDNPHFDSKKSLFFNLKAAKMGSAAAKNSLGHSAYAGDDKEISLDEAEYWFRQTNNFYMLAKMRMGYPEYFLERDPNEENSYVYNECCHSMVCLTEGEENERKRLSCNIKRLLFFARSSGSYWASYDEELFILSGRYGSEGFDSLSVACISNIADRIKNDSQDNVGANACFSLALCYFLGIGFNPNLSSARVFLSKIPNNSNNNFIGTTLQEFRRNLSRAIDFASDNPEKYQSSLSFLQRIIDSPDGTGKNIKMPPKEQLDLLVDMVWGLGFLQYKVFRTPHIDWRKLLLQVQAKRINLTDYCLERSSLRIGPTYNAHANNGFPILGDILAPSKDFAEAAKQMERNGFYVPPAGIVEFAGVKAYDNGSIEFDCRMDVNVPARLLPEDFDVVMALVFGRKDKAYMASLSLESPESRGIQHDYQSIEYKAWSPSWIGHTDFGRTLMATDYLTGGLCWHPKEFDIVEGDNPYKETVRQFAQELVKDIVLTGGRDGQGESCRVMLRNQDPLLISEKVKKPFFSASYHYFSPVDMRMRVDGSYVTSKDGVEDRLVALNDTDYEQGRVTQKLTDRYNDIASLLPIFERGRQLMALFYTVHHMRERGWRPSELAQKAITQKLEQFEGKGDLPISELLMACTPFYYKREI